MKIGYLRIFLVLFIATFLGIASFGCLRPTSSSGGNLRVTVLGVGNRPLAGAKVISNTQPEGQLKVTGVTQSDGTVTYNDIKAGDYEFYVSRFDYEQKEFSITVKSEQTTDVTVTLAPTSPPAT